MTVRSVARLTLRLGLMTVSSLIMSSFDESPPPVPLNSVTGSPKFQGPVLYTLADAEARHLESPATFLIPTLEQRTALGAGDAVKLIFEITDGNRTEVERMWVLIERGGEGLYEGELGNDPYCTDELKSGAKVSFEARHIIQIEDDS